MKKQKDTSLVGKRSYQEKEALLKSGAIFVYTTQDMYYIVSHHIETGDIAEIEVYTMEVYYFEEDYVNIREVPYASLSLLEKLEPFQLAKFSIVYLLESKAAQGLYSVRRDDIITEVKRYAGIDWTVENISPYELPAEKYEITWKAWIATLSRPYGAMDMVRFLLAVYNGSSWMVIPPKAVHAPIQGSLESIHCEFYLPGIQEIQRLQEQEESYGNPIID
jgi:hypothetical protein